MVQTLPGLSTRKGVTYLPVLILRVARLRYLKIHIELDSGVSPPHEESDDGKEALVLDGDSKQQCCHLNGGGIWEIEVRTLD